MTDKIVSLATARDAMRRASGSPALPAAKPTIFDPDPAEEALPAIVPVHLSTDRLLQYAREGDALMFRGFGPALYNQDRVPGFDRLEGVRMLRGRPIALFMQAVYDDDLHRAFVLMQKMGPQIRAHMNTPGFFFFQGSDDVCFTTPAHLARTTTMAHALKTEFGARFDIPDSEGRLPQLYWARHARDPYIFLYGEKHLNLNMGDGGNVVDVAHEKHQAPIWEAIDAQNPAATGGLGRCATSNINTPRRGDWEHYTPLMIQAVQTSFTLESPQNVTPFRALKTTWQLAASPNLDWSRRDRDRQTVMDLPLHSTVSRLLTRARGCAI